MKKILILIASFIIFSCQTAPVALFPAKGLTEFQQLQKTFFDEYWEINPGHAMHAGHPGYQAALVVPSEDNLKQQVAFYKKYQKTFSDVKTTHLSKDEQADLDILTKVMDRALWYLEVFQSHHWDPSNYNIGYALGKVWENREKSTTEKIRLLNHILQLAPAYYEAGFKNIKTPTKEHLDLAIKQNQGTLDFIEKYILSQNLDQKFSDLLKESQTSIKNYIVNLEGLKESHTRKKSFKSFRLSPKIYDQKFRHDLETINSAKTIYKKAIKDRDLTHRKMIKISNELWSKYYPKDKPPKDNLEMVQKVLYKISLQHSAAESFVSAVREQIPQLINFVEEKNLLSLDKSKPLKIRETPEYMRGVAAASIDSPGPFEKNRETFYNVTPPASLSAERQQSFLREYNNYMLQILNIHEAIPGHYAQLIYGNKSTSPVKSIFGNGTMVEGWAVYTERMMLEEGYGNHSPELWLTYYKWFLRVTSNAILDYSIHNLNMTKAQAMDLLVRQAFQETTEAEEKWNRATLTQVQLNSYYAGFEEIYGFREKLKKQQGPKFNLKKFHEQFLSYGNSPIKTIIHLMEN